MSGRTRRGSAFTPHVATAREVTCATKHAHREPHKGITHLGGRGWRMTRWQVTAAINSGGDTFYLLVGGTRAPIGVVDADGEPYLRATLDGRWTDDLLTLPACPVP